MISVKTDEEKLAEYLEDVRGALLEASLYAVNMTIPDFDTAQRWHALAGGDSGVMTTEDEDKMLYIGGSKTSFRCGCGCNVFRALKADPSRYKCNGCRSIWKGVED